MKLLRLEVSNFKSFVGRHDFDFPSQPGLYFMSGQNKDEPRLEANGAGKSTLWDALTWLIYGTTSQGLKAGDVSSWVEEGKKATVSVTLIYLDSSGARMKLNRKWNPNAFTLRKDDGEPEDIVSDETNPFRSTLCSSGKSLDLQAFLSSVFFAQGKPMFLDLTPSAKATLFSEILSLDNWLEYSDRSSDQAKKTEGAIAKVSSDISREQGRLVALSESNYDAFSNDWQTLRTRKREDLRKKIIETSSKIEPARSEIEKTQGELNKAQELCHVQENFVSSAKRNLEEATKLKMSKYEIYLGSKMLLLEAEKKLNLVTDGNKCPTCGSTIGRLSRRTHLDEARVALNAALTDCTLKKSEYQRANEKYESAKRAYDESRDLLDETKNIQLRAKQDARRHAIRTFELLDSNLRNLELELEALDKEVNPFLEKQKTVDSDIRRTTMAIQGHQEDLDFLQEIMAGYSWWVKGFKDVRLQQIQQALTQLEIEVNSCLVQLGLVGWALRFDVNKESRSSRKITKGFHVMVEAPSMKKPVPWEAWSGGEAQRLRLAASLGLGNLIRSTYGVALPLEIWDEPTNYMSQMGVDDLLVALSSRAQEERRQIWLVDHHTLGSSEFYSTVRITKQGGTSQIGPLEDWVEGE